MPRTPPIPSRPSAAESLIARETKRILASRTKTKHPLRLRMLDDPAKRNRKTFLHRPSSLLIRILDEMASGNTVTLLPVQPELTTQEAAEALNVSRPSLIQLLDEGKIEFRRVGTHRRVRFGSLMAYKRRALAERRAVLTELAAYDQELAI